MDHPENVPESDEIESDIPERLEHLTEEELKAGLWDTQTCQRCLSCFHPELAGPVYNEPRIPPVDVPGDGVILHNSPANLATGLSQGCWWCSRLFFKIQREYDTTSMEDFSQRYPNYNSVFWKLDHSSYLLEYRLGERQRGMKTFTRLDWTRSSREYLLDKEGTYHRPPAGTPLPSFMCQLNKADRNTGLQRSMQFISDQIHNCRKAHESCGRLLDSTWYPRRLLKILSAGDGSIVSLRVVETRDGDAVDGPYATLSYCWGGRLHLRLLTDTYEEFSNAGIPAAKIPQLFLDAAFAASKFGASYIWIDALCIIQDSTDDWLRECTTMHLVYENGLCNIMAASAAHSEESLFRTRDPRLLAPCIVRGSDSRKISTYSEDTQLLEDDMWCCSFGLLPLYKRGWILQERLLMTRSIIFTRDQIYFQCINGTTRDISPRNTFMEPGLTLSSMGPRGFTYENCFQKWLYIVTAYGRTSLSEQRDTLIAVSGLAEKIKQVRPSRYVHGLWEADLVNGLTWQDAGKKRRVELSVPSWSWASVCRPSYAARPNPREIPDASATTSEDKLRLRGPMFSISIDTSSAKFDPDLVEKAIRERMDLLSVPHLTSRAFLDGSDAEKEERPVPRTLLIVPLLLYSQEPLNSTNFLMALRLGLTGNVRACVGLLLEPVAAAWGFYRRVGLFEIEFEKRETSPNLGASEVSASESREESEEHLSALCVSQPEDMRNHEYDEATKEHTIYLV